MMGKHGEIVVELVPKRIDNITSSDFDPGFWKDADAVQAMVIQECQGVYASLPEQYREPVNTDYIDRDSPLISGPHDLQMIVNLDNPFIVFLSKEAMLKSGLSMTMTRCPTVSFHYAVLEPEHKSPILLAALDRFYIREQKPNQGLIQIVYSEAADPHMDKVVGGLDILDEVLPSGTVVHTRSDHHRHLHAREYTIE